MSSRPKRKVETPSMSRVKAEPASSPPDFRASKNLREADAGAEAIAGSSYAPYGITIF